MKRNGYLLFTILLVGAYVLGACASQPTQPTQAPAGAQPTQAPAGAQPTQVPTVAEPITLEYWTFADYASGAAGELQKTFISEFEAANPGVKIVMSGKNDDELSTGIVAAAASKTLPDIFVGTTDFGAAEVKMDAVENIYDRWMAMPEAYRSQFNPSMVADMTPVAKTMWAMPYTGFSVFLYRNLTVLKAAGIDPNEPVNDWATWLVQMKKIKDAGYDALGTFTDTFLDSLVFYSGVATDAEWGIDWANKKTNINPDKFVQMMNFLLEARKYGTEIGNYQQGAMDLFLANKLAYIVTGPWTNVTFLDAKKNTGLEYDYVVTPGATADNPSGGRGTEMITLAGNGKHNDIAWKFVTYISDEPQMTRWATLLGRYNCNLVTLSKVKDPLLVITAEAAKSALLIKPPAFVKAYPDNYPQTYMDAMAAIESGQISPEDGAKQMVQKLNGLIMAEE